MTAHPEGQDWSFCDNALEHRHVNNPLRDAHSSLAHSLSDEAYRRPAYDFYRPSLGEQLQQAVGCLAQAAGILIAALVLWGLLFAMLLGVPS